MKSLHKLLKSAGAGALMTAAVGVGSPAIAGPEVVPGPGVDPECFKHQSDDTNFFQWPAKEGPYRIALVNGFIANDWRVQMIRVAKAYAEQPSVAADIKEFKVVSVGEDIAAQIAAANNFIDQGFDAVIVNANNTAAFGGVVRKANDANVVLLSFDNVIDSADQIAINVDQKRLGELAAEFLLKETTADPARFLHVRGPAGQPVEFEQRRNDCERGVCREPGGQLDVAVHLRRLAVFPGVDDPLPLADEGSQFAGGGHRLESRHGILLQPQLRDEKAVDDVLGTQEHLHLSVHGHRQDSRYDVILAGWIVRINAQRLADGFLH